MRKSATIHFFVMSFFVAASFFNMAQAQTHQAPTASATSWHQNYSLILMNNTTNAAANQARDYVVSQSGRIAIIVPPHVMLGWVSPDLAQRLPGQFGIESVSSVPMDLTQLEYQDEKTRAALAFFNAVASGERAEEAARPARQEQEAPLIDDALEAPPLNQADYEKNLRPFGIAAAAGNSDSMVGTVAVALFFIESNGDFDPNQYTWTPADQQATYNRALDGLSWWSSEALAYGVNVTFSVELYSATNPATQQGYEPILHSSSEDGAWIGQIMANLGFTAGDHISRVAAFNTWLKDDAATDWAYSVFIGYNPLPAPSTFTNGRFAYAYLGGPYTQMLFRNNGWAPETFGLVLSHETGHIFWACDEYYQPGYGGCTSCEPCVPSNAPRPTARNGNCVSCNLNSVPCMMRGNDLRLCHYTPPQIGWADPNCAYTISPTNRLHNSGAETGTVTVTTGNGCPWKAESYAFWITITSGHVGAGNGTVSYAVAANPGEGYRTGVLVVAGQNVEITQAPAVPVCFSDNFDDGDADGWTPLNANHWQVSDDAGSLRYFLNTTNYDSPDGIRMGEISLTSSGPWGDFVFECLAKSADVAIGNEAADLCIAFGYQDFDSYYYVNFNASPGLTQLHRIHNGNQVTLATYNDATFNDGNYHALRIERSGSQIRAFFGGAELFSITDNFFGAGQIGLGSYNDSGYFDDIKIDSPACNSANGPFTDITAALPAVERGAAAWGDYDNDGDLDILLTGRRGLLNPIAKIYRNEGAGNFVDINAPLTGVFNSAVAWGDHDNDGDLDFLLTGTPNSITTTTKLYLNNNGSFGEAPISFAEVDWSAVAWGDYDNDGDLDVLLTGETTEGSRKLKIYRNERGYFADINLPFSGVSQGSAVWGDYDNDGDLDFLVTGFSDDISAPYVSKIYRNDGNEAFVDINAPLIGLNASSAAFGDYDNDGDLDMVLTGLTRAGPPVARIYRNHGGNFVDTGMALTGVYHGSVAWGDYDNDGDLDILLSGIDGVSITKIYRNDGGSFTDIAATLTGVYASAAVWGDYDNDGDLDILLTGSTGGGHIAKIYRNNTATPNTVPRAPAGLAATAAQNTVTFNWNKATDSQTAANALTYNLRLGRTPGGGEVMNPMSEVSSGFRRVAQLGNTNHNNSWTIRNLADGKYYWSVQAIDNAFAGSAFAPEQSFSVLLRPAAPKNLQAAIIEKKVTLTWTANTEPNLARYRIYRSATSPASAGIDSVNSFTTTYTDNNVIVGNTYFYRITAVTGSLVESDFSNEVSVTVKPETFTDIAAGLSPLNNASATWGDYDNDGDLDILLIGNTGLESVARLYRNDAGKFVDSGAPLQGLRSGSPAFGDYDNDGDLDILLAGLAGFASGVSKIYRNDAGNFVDFAAPLGFFRGGTAAFGDYDNDGDLDVLLTNASSTSSASASMKIYRNDAGNFVDIAAPLASSSSGAFGDYDNDGDLDILTNAKIYRNDNGNFAESNVTLGNTLAALGDYDNDGDLDVLALGADNQGNTLIRIYRNDNGNFTDGGAALTGVTSSGVNWGDYDSDGDLDILSGGRIFRNDNGSFTDSGAALTGSGAVALGDYDNDGDLDLLIGGRVFRNNLNKANAAPMAPANPVATVNGSAVTLKWNKAIDNETPPNGLTYQLRLGTTPGGHEIVSPMSEVSSGYRRLPQMGNVNHNSQWKIQHLPTGKYYWSVQALDHGFVGSAFAPEQSFVISQAVATPAGLRATAGFQSATLNWVANRDSSFLRYRIFAGVSPNPTTPIDSVEGAGNTTTIISGLTNGATYYFRLKAVNKALAASPFSNEASATPFFESFTETAASLPSARDGKTAWGDYDNDGDLDALVGFAVYRNDNGKFANLNAGLIGAFASDVAWGDYDNDGDLDILLGSKIYRNDGAGFVDIAAFTNVFSGPVAWGDCDNDGDLDILAAGVIYRNDRGKFVDLVTLSLSSSGVWGDYDNDGDLDILATGSTANAYVSKIYRNDQRNFVDIAAPLLGVAGSGIWGDYDNDGDLDILLSGFDNSSRYAAKIYRNDGGNFVDVAANFGSFSIVSTTFVDYDNDGDLDIGAFDGNLVKIFRNDAGNFVDAAISLAGITGGLAWGDYDNDRDLDLLALSGTSSQTTAKIYRNNIAKANTVPTAPSNLAATVSGNAVTISWNKSADNETAANGLNYNLRIGATSGGQEVMSPMSEVNSGFRRIPQIGNANHNTRWKIERLPKGTYYYSVQALDHAFSGSAFALERSFTIAVDPSVTAPQNLQVTAAHGEARLRWQQNPEINLLRYRIYGGTAPNPAAKVDSVDGVANTKKTVTGLTNNVTYYFRVTAVDSAGRESAFSNEVSAAPFFQQFTDMPTTLPQSNTGTVAWGDYDNDGDLDILAGAKIYRNDNGSFVDAGTLAAGKSSWGDYDNDGDLDVLALNRVYRNDRGNFVDIGAALARMSVSISAWGDCDNDGDLDILLTGNDNTSRPQNKIYRNNAGNFVEASAALIGVSNSAVAFGDYDNDGDLDIFLTGFASSSSSNAAKIYRNDNGYFSDLAAPLAGVQNGAAAWGDYDGDGDLDLLVIGNTPAGNITKIYRNDNGNFIDIAAALPGVAFGAAAFGDYDNDGDLDIFLAGDPGSSGAPVTKIYRNDGGNFSEVFALSPALKLSAAAWGDHDNDGDLDILLSGADANYKPMMKVLRNNVAAKNTVPNTPSALASATNGNTVALSWNKAADSQTNANSLTYNLRVGKTPGGHEILSPMSEANSGFRRVPQLGNVNHNNRWTLKNFPAGTYYWSAQAIDNALAGSKFAEEKSFTITLALNAPQHLTAIAGQKKITLSWKANTESNLRRYRIYRGAASPASTQIDSVAAGATKYTDNNVTSNATYYYRITAVDQNGNASPFSNEVSAQLTSAAFSDLSLSLSGGTWGDYDNDGDLDILGSTIYRNDNGSFVDIGAKVANGNWGDYDNDSDLDILAGAKIYRNDNGNFVEITAITDLTSVAGYWGDYDNDGDLDILLIGAGISKIYRNENGAFADIVAGLKGVNSGAAAWGDVDNDRDLDILLAGNYVAGRIAKIYRNDAGNFVDMNAPLTPVSDGSVAFGDYDNDGDLDIVLTGNRGIANDVAINTAEIYRNDNGSFVSAAGLTGVYLSASAFGDYDNDGDLDLLVTGITTGFPVGDPSAIVYRNDAGRFVGVSAGLPGAYGGSVAWGDYDNDGALDILMSGAIFRNNTGAENTAPLAPANLVAAVAGNAATFSWSKSSDNETTQNGLTYNLRLATTADGVDKFSPMADVATGYRRVAQFGNTNHNTMWTIRNLPKAKYYWNVQAIDNAFAGSMFALEQTFVLGDTVWPGDTNNNRLVDQADVLPIGLYFNKTGPKRDNASIIWRGQVALPWTPEAATHADANGDGIINQADVLPIGLNWARVRTAAAFALGKSTGRSAVAANLGVKVTGDTNPGKDFWLDVHADSVKNLFGIAFELLYSPATFLHPDSVFAGNWLGGDLVFFSYVDTTAGKISVAVSRKAGQEGRDSSGVIARIKMRMSSRAVRGQVTQLTLQNVAANDPDGNPILFEVTNSAIVTNVASRTNEQLPATFALHQNIPNPFNPSTTIKYDVPEAVEIRLEIFDMLGRLVRTLVNQRQLAGRYAVIWDGRDEYGKIAASGVFIYRLRAGSPASSSGRGFVQSRKMLLIR